MGRNICEACGGRIERVVGKVPIEFRETTVLVDAGEHDECVECHESYIRADAMAAMEREAVEYVRREKGLLTPDQIQELRRDLGLTQVDLEEIVGVGPKSVTRWEKGSVFQSNSADKIMRAIWRFPSLSPIFLGKEIRVCQVVPADVADYAWPWSGKFITNATTVVSDYAHANNHLKLDLMGGDSDVFQSATAA